ncbi:tRNA epoxyqueuosine(34) reductase QueG [Clostridium sp. SYSU_GA19001]|uniref:tRNA epoxyqueuosine(34) reductase QueG n=1 Tax=Clostridium caldaquaticum TaxID=2940653 RepID=UPI002077902D|nr:tRNA epoxyqueuosine(34) reductase QueG [Clostridium caldaquaticum]MCM8711112.1 tRNA epoxyqueuosine(34) reductase QueG [Clostridium caldaquaticum]
MNYKSKLVSFCNELGLDIIGFCSCRIFYELKTFFENRKINGLENEFEEKDIDKRINPLLLMRDGKTIISIAFPYAYDLSQSGNVYFSKYTWGKDYHLVVSYYLKKICDFINTLGGKAIYFVDSNELPERYIAYLCGIGFIGKNNMIITEKYGSYVFLGEIITDLFIEPDEPVMEKCGKCTLCLKTCPTKAINKGESCPNVCLSYITQKKHIEDSWLKKLDGRLFGCDSCQNICPYNKEAELSQIKEFEPYEFMKNVSLDELLNIDNKIFKEKYANTSCGWRGKNILQRNALIYKALKTENMNIDIKSIKSPYVEDYYHRLLKALQL